MTDSALKKHSNKPQIKIRPARLEDASAMAEVAIAAYAAWPATNIADKRNYALQIAAFPSGQFLAVADGQIVGFATSLIVQLDDDSPWYNHAELTGYGTFSTHDPAGQTLYGADIAVHPDWQGQGVSKLLYRARRALMKRHNLKQMVAGGRMPGYAQYRGQLTAQEYVDKVKAGELRDSAINAHLRAGYDVRGVHYGYLDDQESLGYATHLVMTNPDFQPRKRLIAGAPVRRTARHVRVCATQYDQRRIATFDDFAEQIEYFADSASSYDSHLLLFPEFVTAQLFSTMERGTKLPDAVAQLVAMAPRIDALFQDLAIRHRLHLVSGTTPVLTERGLRNVAHLYTPSGASYTQEKLHVTPAEREYWGIMPGDGIKVFETAIGRLAIVVCYDIEFPELTRMLVEHGVDIILNPFATDERKSYLRVRYCAQARAVENMVYVVMSGNVGGLSRSPSMFLNYGQAAICTPSDFAFPMDGIAAEGIVNTQTVVVADLDLGALDIQRQSASVRPLLDRRHDLYELQSKVPVERVTVV
ncbi:MAG TPA: bifunctional GNAT family N-acetyltransferase/carbon-nitrogen hydrolase family protein [Rudaea sp.]|nr:bifunctional GNAT family N-acetyltransferase/carbon-nitrogen hydrolase family protein [Rudaea sp.]